MWLINTESLRLIRFTPPEIPCYAILSHRWEDGEVNFSQFQSLDHAALLQLKGYQKIIRFCELARYKKLLWAWVDTCCIDKSSSSELSEAINSMWSWYQNSTFCSVYLSDVRSRTDTRNIEGSRWFTRGWTLQELLAPDEVEFYTLDWFPIGNRRELCGAISRATGVPSALLYSMAYQVHEYSVAQRLSWAAERETTRPEDKAYCLIGLFKVNMPLIYGEGTISAFRRLQLEIIKDSNDETLFAWTASVLRPWTSLFAQHPYAFRYAGDIVPDSTLEGPRTHTVTNRGLQFEARVLRSDQFLVDDDADWMQNVAEQIETQIQEDKSLDYIRLGPDHERRFVLPLCCNKAGSQIGLVVTSVSWLDGAYLRRGIVVVPKGGMPKSREKQTVFLSSRELDFHRKPSKSDIKYKSMLELEAELRSIIRSHVVPESVDQPAISILGFMFFTRDTEPSHGLQALFSGFGTVNRLSSQHFRSVIQESNLPTNFVKSFLERFDAVLIAMDNEIV